MDQRKCKNGKKKVSLAACGYRVLSFVWCTTIMIVVLTVTSGLGYSFDQMVWFGWGWDGFDLACVESYDL
jgi:hypothetical protein